MFSKLDEVEQRYEELSRQLSDMEVVQNRSLFEKLSKEYKAQEKVVLVYRDYKKVLSDVQSSKDIIYQGEDADLVALAKEELKELEEKLPVLEQELQILLLPKDPNDDKNVILEIRAGAGGDEASIFAGDLFRMYSRYAETLGWKIDLMSASEGSTGGYKEVIAMIAGEGAYSKLKYESGVHRVQRVPTTESQGRVHTSTCTVAVLPEAEEVDVEINEKDLRIDVYRASGPGGQCVNTTDSAVRITHIPTGIVVAMQDEKSQFKNKDKAMRILRARLLEQKEQEMANERSEDRKSQVGTGDRSEKIRTYNYPQSRVTDHRIGYSIHNLDALMEGDVDLMLDPVIAYFQSEALKHEG
ncbi:MAG: peptide chain release factor 1 [Bdellovibrionota bacterium]